MVKEELNNLEDEECYALTKQAIMQLALRDFGINVNIYVAKAITDHFVDMMVKHGHIKDRDVYKIIKGDLSNGKI